jgi:hypothetical protein
MLTMNRHNKLLRSELDRYYRSARCDELVGLYLDTDTTAGYELMAG